MPSRKPRIALTIPADVKKIYDEGADALGITTTKFVVQILEEAVPAVRQLTEAYNKAKSDPIGGLESFVGIVDHARTQATADQVDIEQLIEEKKNQA